MQPRTPEQERARWATAGRLLEFRPWMLALAVFLGCALGIAVMEQFREGGVLWAQAEPQQQAQQASR
jgi:hypothetical protein